MLRMNYMDTYLVAASVVGALVALGARGPVRPLRAFVLGALLGPFGVLVVQLEGIRIRIEETK